MKTRFIAPSTSAAKADRQNIAAKARNLDFRNVAHASICHATIKMTASRAVATTCKKTIVELLSVGEKHIYVDFGACELTATAVRANTNAVASEISSLILRPDNQS
jgi:hypothetical protein